MGELYEYACVAVVTGWLFSGILKWVMPTVAASLAGLGIGAALSVIYLVFPASAWVVALFSPVSLGLAIYALADMFPLRQLLAPKWSITELLVLLLVWIAFVATSLGVGPVNPYGWGYLPTSMAPLMIALAAYAVVRRDLALGATVAGAQGVWMIGLGSENLFDHLVSFLIVPAILTALFRRFTGT